MNLNKKLVPVTAPGGSKFMELVSLVGKQDFILDHLRELRREIIMSGESPVLPARLTDALHLLDKLDNCAPDNENPKEDS